LANSDCIKIVVNYELHGQVLHWVYPFHLDVLSINKEKQKSLTKSNMSRGIADRRHRWQENKKTI
jgi:hypothetical protein